MSFYVFTPDLSNRHKISQAVSISTHIKYNNIGTFSITLLLDDYNLKMAELGSIVIDTDTYNAFVVVNTKIDTSNSTIEINGYTANWLLNKRTFWGSGFGSYDTDEKSIYEYITRETSQNLRKLPDLELAVPKGLTKKERIYVEGGQLLDVIISMLDINGYGNKTTWNDDKKKIVFEIYEGQDLTEGIHSVTFSYERGDVKKLVINDDISEYKNCVYAPGIKANGNSAWSNTYYTSMADNNRYEKWIKNVSRQTQNQTDTEFTNMLAQIANAELKKQDNKKRQNFFAEINAEEFGKKYNLGDIVNCISTQFGVQFKARITSAKHVIDNRGESVSLTLGEPNII